MIKNVGKYAVKGLLGKGFLAEVYSGFDTKTNRKVLIRHILNEDLWISIIENKEKILSLHSPNLANFLAIISVDGYKLLIQEYIEGITVNNMIADLKYSFSDVLHVAIDICSGLQIFHSNGFVHHDIKPSNIIYNQKHEKAVLIDYDFAFLKQKAKAYKFVGTVLYTSPEQLLDSAPSEKSDVYSLGLVLFELLFGQLPFDRSEDGINDKIKKDVKIVDIVSKYNLSYEITIQFVDTIVQMIQIDVEERINLADAIKVFKEINEMNLNELSLAFIEDSWESENAYNFANAYFQSTAIIELSMPQRVRIKDTVEDGKNLSNIEILQRNKDYKNKLFKEYDNILLQAKISFGLWVGTFIIALATVIISIVLIILGRYQEALFSALLESLLYICQHLFAMREDFFRDLMTKKMEHLEAGDYFEFAFGKLDHIKDEKEKNEMVKNLINSIRDKV